MNQYPLWKYFVVLFVLAIGILYSAPNIYPPDPAVQISGSSGAQVMGETELERAIKVLDRENIEVKATEITGKNIVIRLQSQEHQLAAKDYIKDALGVDYVVALNLAPNTPPWLESIGAEPMKLGLDLSGGVHFLLEVDTEFAIKKRLDGFKASIKKLLYDNKVRGFVDEDGMTLKGKFKNAELRDEAYSLVTDEIASLTPRKYEEDDAFWVEWSIGEALQKQYASEAVNQNLTALRNRVNELGVSEPIVQRQGEGRIVVELPGVQDSAEAKRIIGKIANLEFRLEAGSSGASETFNFKDRAMRGARGSLERSVVITGDQVSTAQSSFDENGRPQVNITLDGEGGRLMNAATRSNIGRRLGVLFIERKVREKQFVDEETGEKMTVRDPYFVKEIISLATIQSALGVQFRITGLDSPAEAKELALLLRAGALSAPIDFVEERTIGPSLGAENIDLGLNAVILGMALVLVFMLLYYKAFGLAADLALIMNLLVLVAVMSILSATLTLPGIAGIVLTVGMAVDANVLIFSRIREELKKGLKPQQAINNGYDSAFVTIMDANITTLIVAVILYAAGTGPVKGFAVTLAIGILTSMFTSIVGTRALVNLFYGNRNIKKLAI